MTIDVKFPNGTRTVKAFCMGMNLLSKGGGMLKVPAAVPGFKLSRTAAGWVAVKA